MCLARGFDEFMTRSPPEVAFRRVSALSGCLRTDCSRHRHQLPARHPQVRQREQRQQVRRVLLQPTKPHLSRPNWRLITRNGCSTFARMLAFRCSSSAVVSSPCLAHLCDVAGPRGDVPLARRRVYAALCPPIAGVGQTCSSLPCSRSATCSTSASLAAVVVTV